MTTKSACVTVPLPLDANLTSLLRSNYTKCHETLNGILILRTVPGYTFRMYCSMNGIKPTYSRFYKFIECCNWLIE